MLRSATALKPDNALSNYNLACGWSIANDTANGLYCLKKALDEGFKDFNQVMQDGDIGNLRKMPEFNSLMKKYFPDKVK